MGLDLESLRKKEKGNGFLIGTTDGSNLFLREWQSNKESSTALLIFHGITAHSEVYDIIAEPVSKNGIHVFGLDLRGHGLSDGKRGDYPSKQQFHEDLYAVLEYINSRFEKTVILGHSLGIITALEAISEFDSKIQGVILLSGARKIREGVYPKRSLLTTLKILFWSIIKPSKPVIRYYREGMRGLDDPLFNFDYTLRFLRIINGSKIKIPYELVVPLLFAIGDEDELFTVDAAKELFEEFPSGNKEFLVIKGGKHARFPDFHGSKLVSWLIQNFDR